MRNENQVTTSTIYSVVPEGEDSAGDRTSCFELLNDWFPQNWDMVEIGTRCTLVTSAPPNMTDSNYQLTGKMLEQGS